MLNQRLTSSVDFAKLTEETDRLAEHVAEVRRRMMAAAKRKEQRNLMGFRLVVSTDSPEQSNDATAPSSEPLSLPTLAPLRGVASLPPSTRAPASSPASAPARAQSPAVAPKRPASGVFAIPRDRDVGRYCLVADQEPKSAHDIADLPAVAKRNMSA